MTENKLTIQDSTLEYGILQVTRDYSGVKFTESTLSKDGEQLVISEFKASSPHASVMQLSLTNGRVLYLQHIGTPDHALVGILLAASDSLADSLALHPGVKALDAYLNASSKVPDVTLSGNYSLSDLAGFNGLGGLLFAALAGLPVLALGSDEPAIKKVFLALLTLVPPGVARTTAIKTYTESYSDRFHFTGMPVTPETAALAVQHSDTHAIVDVNKQAGFSPYESQVTDQLAAAIQSNDGAGVVALLADIYGKAWQAKEQGENVADIAVALQCSKADAELYHLMGEKLAAKPAIQQNRIR